MPYIRVHIILWPSAARENIHHTQQPSRKNRTDPHNVADNRPHNTQHTTHRHSLWSLVGVCLCLRLIAPYGGTRSLCFQFKSSTRRQCTRVCLLRFRSNVVVVIVVVVTVPHSHLRLCPFSLFPPVRSYADAYIFQTVFIAIN